MKRMFTLILALLMTILVFGGTAAYAEEETADPAAEPVNPYVGLWEITGQKDGDELTVYADAGMKAYLDFLPNGAIYAVMTDGTDVIDDYLAYEVTGENALDLYEGGDPIPAVYDPETGVITATEPEYGTETYVQRVTEDPLPDIRALVDHSDEEQTWYGYTMTEGELTVNLLEMLPQMDMDPRDFYLTLAPDGTGYLQFGDEEAGGEITWTETEFIAEDEGVPYTREGDHILLAIEETTILELAPEGEVEALLAVMEHGADDETDAEPVEFSPEDVVGSWEFTKAKAYGTEVPASATGQSMSLVLKEDGAASLTAGGSTTDNLEYWFEDDGSVVLGVGSYEALRLTFDGTVLTLNSMGVEMIFERVD